MILWIATEDTCEGIVDDVVRISKDDAPWIHQIYNVQEWSRTDQKFLCIGVAVWKQNAITVAPLLGGILALGAAIAFPLVTLAERTEEQGRRRAGWEDALLEKLVAGLTSRDYSLLVLLCAVFGTLAWFLWAAAAGAHVFWFVLAFLLWKAGRFTKLFHSS